MTNVVSLPGVEPSFDGVTPEPNVVAMLRDWLEMAERGEIVSVAICASTAKSGVLTAAANSRVTTMDALLAVTVLRLRIEQDFLMERDA